MNKITPFLWFEKNLKAVTDFYISVFPGAKLDESGNLSDTPSGEVETATLNLYGQSFNLMAAGPYYKFNPTVSFLISCENTEEVDSLWGKLSEGGKVMMPLSSYPFADKYGWVEDKFGVSWQIMFSSSMKAPQKITPTLMFAGSMCGKAKEATDFYTSIFKDSKVDYVVNYEPGENKETEGTTKHAGITIENYHISLMDSGVKNDLTFEQAVSFVVDCKNQEEIDYYWSKLTDGGKEIQCGWLVDKFGFPWQVVPSALQELLSSDDKEKVSRVTKAFLKMIKFDIKALQNAFDGESVN